jgi:hypothetical protein
MALVRLNGAYPVAVGEIARPYDGALTVNSPSPFYVTRVNDYNRGPNVSGGETVYKVGKTTGFSSGYVYDACWD